jgi:hypothetical protein
VPDILADPGTMRGPLRLASHTTQTFTWKPSNLDKHWARGGQWLARLQLVYAEDPGSSPENKAISWPFTLGHPETLEDIFQLSEHREALLELYYRLRDRQIHDGFQSLTPTEAMLVDLWDLQGFFSHAPGNSEYFVHRGDRAPYAVAGLQTIGASCVAKLLKDIVAYFPGGKIPATPREIEQITNNWACDGPEQLDQLWAVVWAKHGGYQRAVCREDYNQLLYAYLLQHRADLHW